MSWLRKSVDQAALEQSAAEEVQSAPAPTAVAVLERPPESNKPRATVDTSRMDADLIADYRKTCEEIGVDPRDIVVEEFRHFLAANDIPSFNLREVVSYMDDLTAKDNPTKLGWHWCPVRPKDAEVPMAWGKPSEVNYGLVRMGADRPERTPASDFYQSHNFYNGDDFGWSGGMIMAGLVGRTGTVHPSDPATAAEAMQAEIDGTFHRRAQIRAFWSSPSPAYTRTLPLHALKKIALIEREFKHRVVFLVTEYTTTPDIVINPDPFLMAVIPNSAVSHGKGRFIIDIWDEPGFGIERMLK